MPCLSYACSADRSVCLYARAHVTVLSFSCSDHFKDFGLFTVQGIVSKKTPYFSGVSSDFGAEKQTIHGSLVNNDRYEQDLEPKPMKSELVLRSF